LYAELGSDVHLVAPALYRLADEPLVGKGTVHVGGVEKGHAEIYGPPNGGDGLVLLAGPIEFAHPHASQADLGYDQSFAAEPPLIHPRSFRYHYLPDSTRLADFEKP
jgi:hypothetical protein